MELLILSKNKKAYFDYEILDDFKAGIKLFGQEVKSVKAKQIKLPGSFIFVKNGTCYLKNCHIPKYSFARVSDYNPTRDRVLLLHKKEIEKIAKRLDEKGISVVPLEVYLQQNLVKIKIGVGRGKKKYDKRETIKKRDVERQIQRAMKKY